MFVGMDFGTTNSGMSVYDGEQALSLFRLIRLIAIPTSPALHSTSQTIAMYILVRGSNRHLLRAESQSPIYDIERVSALEKSSRPLRNCPLLSAMYTSTKTFIHRGGYSYRLKWDCRHPITCRYNRRQSLLFS